MSKAATLQLTQDLSKGLADATMCDRYYRDIVLELGREDILTQASLIPVNAETGEYTLPTQAVEMIDLFYDDHPLMEAKLREVESRDPQWRSRLGPPIVYITQHETIRTFSLYPTPEMNSKDFIFLFGSPFGRDYPAYALAMIHTENREDIPEWLELPVAFDILSREFARESNHRDTLFSKTCKSMADFLLGLVM